MLIIGYKLAKGNIVLPYNIIQVLLVYPLFLFGNYIKLFKEKIGHKIIIAGVSSCVLLIMNELGSISINGGEITNPIYYLIVSVAGWFMLWTAAMGLAKTKFSNVLTYIGQNTMSVLVLHFIAFKVVSIIHIKLNNLSIEKLGDFPVLNTDNKILWVYYFICGFMLPLMIQLVYRKMKRTVISNVIRRQKGNM